MTRLTQLALSLSLTLLATNASAQRHGHAQPAPPDDGRTPMQRAMACRTTTTNEPARNRCLIRALHGGTTVQELGMLGATLMAAGETAEAVRVMRTYLERFPDGPMAPMFLNYVQTHAPHEGPAGGAMTPMQRAQACHTTTGNEVDRNNCIIDALRGHASSAQELGLLGTTQIATGRRADAVRTARTYLQRYPAGPMARRFSQYIDAQQ